jgi:hypothetical protein
MDAKALLEKGFHRSLGMDFAANLRAAIGMNKYKKVVELNAAETTSCCHSHDYCDANMVMHATFVEHKLVTDEDGINAENQDETNLWNAAWDYFCEDICGRKTK